MPNIQLSKNLRTLRKSRHLTQTQVSGLLNISRQAYSNYENTKRTPDLDSLIQLSRLYNISLDELVNQNVSNANVTGIFPTVTAMSSDSAQSIYLDSKEIDFIMKYRDLSEDVQKVVRGFVDSQIKE